MARLAFGWVLVTGLPLILAAGPAGAQFGSIFGDPPPRPPADVPGAGSNDYQGPNGPNRYRRNYPDVPPRAPQERYPQADPQSYPADDRRPLPPPPGPSEVDLPHEPAPPAGSIQAQPLPPPPGANAAPKPAAVPPASQQPSAAPETAAVPPAQQQPGAPIQTLPGLPPGQRQPTGTPQPGQPADTAALTQEVVVPPPPDPIGNPTAVFAGLDKITGRIISFDVKINETVQFGALQVTPRVCYSRAPTEQPRTDAFVAVDEVTLKGEVKRIFTGWMFASSPGLHAVEHPIYDVWLTDCKGAKQTVADTGEKPDLAAAKDPAPPAPARRSRRR